MSSPIVVGKQLSLAEVARIVSESPAVTLHDGVAARVQSARGRLLQQIEGGKTIYGVNTGFGALSNVAIAPERLAALQLNLLRSHAVGVGPELDAGIVRALLVLRAHTLALGASGASTELIDHLLAVYAAGIVPHVPAQGSVGASGDLAPLAHLALVLVGEGQAQVDGHPMPGAEALAARGLAPIDLGPKEGLSLINGTQVTSAIGAVAWNEAAELALAADALAALSLDALLGTADAFDARIHRGKPHPGQIETAAKVRSLLEDSPLRASHSDCGEVQDAYCLRCVPQVHGAARGALRYIGTALEIELNSFTDNPLLLARDDGGFDALSGGNFHAGSVALPLDHLSAAMTTLGTISERRLDRFLNPGTSRGLPAFLASDPGVESGFMMAQVTASALASENKGLSMPASVDTIPTSAGKEDHVSMGPIAARKALSVTRNLSCILAIEGLIAARALDLRAHPTSPVLRRVHEWIRERSGPIEGDRSLSAEIETLAADLRRGGLREAAELPSAEAAFLSPPTA